MTVMAETIATATPKAKSKPVAIGATAFETPKFEMPRFEMPKFEMPKFEVPAAFREFAEKGIAQAKENYEKVKSVAEEATDVLEDTYSTASKGCASYGLKVIETTRANSDAAFDLMSFRSMRRRLRPTRPSRSKKASATALTRRPDAITEKAGFFTEQSNQSPDRKVRAFVYA